MSGELLNTICKAPGMPSESLVRQWECSICEAPLDGFPAKYARARSIGRQACAERMETIFDGAKPDEVPALKGKLDAMKWTYAKMDKTKWGDRVAIAGDAEAPLVVTDLRRLSDAELATLATLAEKAKAAE